MNITREQAETILELGRVFPRQKFLSPWEITGAIHNGDCLKWRGCSPKKRMVLARAFGLEAVVRLIKGENCGLVLTKL